MVITSTGSTCSRTLTVTWNGQGKAMTSLSGVLTRLVREPWASPSPVRFASPQKRGSFPVSFTLTTRTGEADVTATGSGFTAQTTSHTVTC